MWISVADPDLGKGLAIKKKTFFETIKIPQKFCPLSSGGGGKFLSGRATKKNNFFCGFPYLAE